MRRTRAFITLLISLIVVASSFYGLAPEVNASIDLQSSEQESALIVSDESQNNESENDLLAEEYISRILEDNNFIPSGSSYAYRSLFNGDANDLYIYDTLYTAVREIAAGKRFYSQIEISISDLPVHEYSIDEFDEAGSVMSLLCDDQKINQILLYSLPYDLYWYDKTAGLACSYPAKSNFEASGGKVTLHGSIKFSFAVAEEYRDPAETDSKYYKYYVNPVFSQSLEEAKILIDEIISSCANYSDYEKIRHYAVQICGNVSYNHAAAADPSIPYGNPWQLVWVFDSDPETNVVCEGYAKAFQYLCDRTNFNNDEIYAYCVSGSFGPSGSLDNHMWNIIHMDDGKNYLVDITNIDEGTVGYDDKSLFLNGYTSIATASRNYDDGSSETIQGYYFSCGVYYFYKPETEDIYPAGALAISDSRYQYAGPEISPAPSVTEEPSPSVTDEPSPSITDTPFPTEEITTVPTETLTNTPVPVVTKPANVKPTVTTFPAVTNKPSATVKPTAKPTVTSKPSVTATPSLNPTAPVTKPVTPTPSEQQFEGVDAFVVRLYTVALGRGFDQGGLDYWTDRVVLEGLSGADLAEGFLFSDEFLGKDLTNEEFLDVLYKTFFDREADEGGKTNWLNAMASGLDKKAVIVGFIDSTEWANLCLTYGLDSGGSGIPNIEVKPNENVTDFAERLYATCLGRTSDPNGLSDWAHQLANRKISGSEAAYGFFFSDEFKNLALDDGEFINRLYRTFMDREADPYGFGYWVNKLSAGVSREEVFMGFAQSLEFAKICSDYGIRR